MDKKIFTAVSSVWHVLIAVIVFYAVLWWLGESFLNKVHIEADTAELSETVCMKMAATQMPQSLHSFACSGSLYFLIEREFFFLAPQEGRSKESRKLIIDSSILFVLCLSVIVLRTNMSFPNFACKAQTHPSKRILRRGEQGGRWDYQLQRVVHLSAQNKRLTQPLPCQGS